MIEPLPSDQLRWRCDAAALEFETTADLPVTVGVVGQASAVEALRFGLECDAPGQNVFVRGLTGTGRMTVVHHLLEELKPIRHRKVAYGYVQNFSEPDCPRLLTLPADSVKAFKREIRALADFIRDGLREAVEAAPNKAEREALDRRRLEHVQQITQAFEDELKAAQLALVSVQQGPIALPALFPVVNGKPVAPDEFESLHGDGKVDEEQYQAYQDSRGKYRQRLEEAAAEVRKVHRQASEQIRSRTEEAARAILNQMVEPILAAYPGEDVGKFLAEVIDDVVENRLVRASAEEFDPVELYGINVLIEHDLGEESPIVVENTPTLGKLLGTVEREWGPRGPMPSDYRMIRAGSLLRANGGYLILDARDVLIEPGAWKVLVRALRTGSLEIVPPEAAWGLFSASLKPEPIPLRVRVILVGDSLIYHLLDRFDPDFSNLFKVLADFDSVVDRLPDGARQYADVLARIAAEEDLLPFDRTAVAALAEHGARVAGLHDKLTARFGRIADIAREAAFLASKEDQERVTAGHVSEAVRRTKQRAELPSRRFRELLCDGTIQIRICGQVVGQVNGLAVIQAGPVMYGFPARITASIGAGTAGIIDIEGRAALSGAIHTKGFHILGGLLRHLLQTDHPLAFSASLAFEQSYGSIDGDSASAAEICCLLSALTGSPIRQGIAITGSIDQLGSIQAIGGVNEKIEGFFDTCACYGNGLTGEQGVIIPRSNAGDLMLRHDVVAACAEGRYHIWAVENVYQALELLTGMAAGEPGDDGRYPEGTLLANAVKKAREFWLKSLQKPVQKNVLPEDQAAMAEEPEALS